jgi:DNA topoisomerase VI subunit B
MNRGNEAGAEPGSSRARKTSKPKVATSSAEVNLSAKAKPELRRETFTTSRLLDYFSEKELTLQTGHGRDLWPEVALKELCDNSLDACEGVGIAPQIQVACDAEALIVADNGPGVSPDVVTRVLDFSSKTSSKDYYVSPTRGAQGNALKTILAMPYVLSGGVSGEIVIESQGSRHTIRVSVDRVRQEPVIAVHEAESIVKNGTVVRIGWPDLASSDEEDIKARFLQRLSDYALLNPHVTLEFQWFGKNVLQQRATAPSWVKWKPNDPTAPHWYTGEQLASLISAYLANASNGESRFVRELICEFRGLSGTAKQKIILAETGLAGAKLSELVRNGQVDPSITSKLLEAMQQQSREVKAQALGIIGEDHIRRKLETAGCNSNSIRYKRKLGYDEQHRPYVIETAFGAFERESALRKLLCGLNFSPSIGNPFRRLSGWESLDDLLGEQHVADRTFTLVHLTTPHLRYTDRGKTAVALAGGAIEEEGEQ